MPLGSNIYILADYLKDMKRHYSPLPTERGKLIFIIGEFEERENLRKALYTPKNKQELAERAFNDLTPLCSTNWTEATFGAYTQPDKPNPLMRMFVGSDPFRYWGSHEHKVFLVTHELQNEIRQADIPESLEWFSEYQSILQYNHHIIEEVKREWDHEPQLLSVVVAQEEPDDLESSLQTEFAEGADAFVVGERDAEVYLSLIGSFFGGTVNPRKFKDAYFNAERFSELRGNLLRPIHDYST